MRVSTSFVAFFGILLVSAFVISVQAEHFATVVSSLPRFQGATGGFRDSPRTEESLEATADALFLSSLYGLRNTINVAGVPEFVRGFRNSDGGYGVGGKSDVASTRAAVLAYAHLELTVPEPTQIANFIRSQIDPQNSLFGARPGARGDLQSTAYALEILELLGEGKRGLSQVVGGLNTYLSAHVTTDGSHQYFNFPSEPLSLTTANYFGVYIASRIEFEFDAPEQWTGFISQLQAPSGGFFSDFSRSSVTFQSSAHAVGTLRLLHDSANADVGGTVNTGALRAFCVSSTFDLHTAYFAHFAVALTDHFNQNFKIFASYSTVDSTPVESVVVQGTKLKPEITVRAFSGAAHTGLTAIASATYEDGSSEVADLPFDAVKQQYIASKYLSAESLGAVTYQYTMRLFVVGIGEISFAVSDEKSVGYNLQVSASAVHEMTGQVVHPGQDVSVGTTFTFELAMGTVAEPSITEGDFNIIFSVVDSSNVAITREILPGSGNTRPLKFEFSLNEASIPSGDLGFAFQVQSASGTVHTTAVTKYRLAIPMVASDITFYGANNSEDLVFQLGDTVRVSVQPGSSSDLRSVTAFTTTDHSGDDVGANRKFFLDCVTERGSVVRTIAGQATSNGKYNFEFDLEPSFDSLGSSQLVFRYRSASNEDIVLQNFNSVEEQLYDEPVAISVNTELHLADVIEQPSGSDFFYGNVISFQFEIKDTVSGEYVSVGERGNAYLVLSHASEKGGRAFTSVKVPAEEGDASSFVINWEINPNAVKGASTLSLVAEDADENQVSILEESGKKPVSYNVNIGGDIDIESSTYSSTDFFTSHTAHIVSFTMECQGKSLKDAKLRSSVVYGGEEVYSAPVSYSDAGYSISWTTDHRASPSGTYNVRVFRETDQSKAEENEEWKQKQLRQKLREVELSGEDFDADAFLASLEVESDDAEPLFEVSYYHKEVSRGAPPVKIEWMVMLGLIAAFIYASKKKVNYE